MRSHLLSHHDPDVGLVRGEVAELHQGPEGLFHVTRLLHTLGVGQEVGARVRKEPLLGTDLAHAQICLMPLRHVPDDLLADCDGVVR